MDLTSNSEVMLSTARAGRRAQRLAAAVVLLSLLAFGALAPFAKLPMTPVWAFIPCYESMLLISDLITAVLLLGQVRSTRCRGVLALACGYFFTAGMTVVHALTFPGLFSAGGLLGAGPQSTAWLYMLWHGGFPLFVLAYARLQASELHLRPGPRPLYRVILRCVLLTFLLVAALGALATVGHDRLPHIMVKHHYAPVMTAVVGTVWSFSVFALFTVWRKRQRSMLDLWLMVVMCAWLIDIALSALLNGARFDLGFYAGRIYGLMAANFVLMVLMVENGTLYLNLSRMADELRQLSMVDTLTGIANRRQFDATLEAEWRRTLRSGTPLALLMLDIDFFKCYNDAYGHVAGDCCLRRVGQLLAASARRPGELAARYGGEEFAVLLPGMDGAAALVLAQGVCHALAALGIEHAHSAAAGHVTASIGVAAVEARSAPVGHEPRDAVEPTLLVEAADRALYASKADGRNRATLAPSLWPAETEQRHG
ncbi:GGDEF domain-containing protein [Janthinobacterium sp. BJB412]|nr:GGDEF domain-containing protein [Janthinobacterium sp. BJB412]